MNTLLEAKAILPRIVELRRRIHAHPELGNHLPITTASVLAELADLGLEIRKSKKSTSIVATLHGAGPGPRILLRGDMDALPMDEESELPHRSTIPGAAHMCGHDAHTSMLVGAARALSGIRDHLPCSVRFAFRFVGYVLAQIYD